MKYYITTCSPCESSGYDLEAIVRDEDKLCQNCNGYGEVPAELTGFMRLVLCEWKPIFKTIKEAWHYLSIS